MATSTELSNKIEQAISYDPSLIEQFSKDRSLLVQFISKFNFPFVGIRIYRDQEGQMELKYLFRDGTGSSNEGYSREAIEETLMEEPEDFTL